MHMARHFRRQAAHFLWCSFMLFSLFAPTGSDASLIPVAGVPIVYDSSSGLYWYSDLNSLIGTKDQQTAYLSTLRIDGFSGFRLADISEAMILALAMTSPSDPFLFTYTGSVYHPGGNSETIWFGRTSTIAWTDQWPDGQPLIVREGVEIYSVGNSLPAVFQRDVLDDYDVVEADDAGVGAWVIATPDTAPVPEPGTLLLVGSALAGLGMRMRKKAA